MKLKLKWINDKDRWKVILGTHYLLKKDDGESSFQKQFGKKVKFQNFSDNLFTNSERNYIIETSTTINTSRRKIMKMYSVLEKL
ncbi:MAG: hypothetical protein CM15mP4_2940 [Candidatus Neomarinimicrobiota bacterium]|nr:MAG: hypothetical protein CM15mP4_2940 [Candidatus Neomarinimicrobiota bacterium]